MTRQATPATRVRAIALASLTAALTTAALVLQAIADRPDVAETLLVCTFAVLGLIVALRAPGNSVGWLMLSVALLNSVATTAQSLLFAARDVWHMPNLAKAAAVASAWQWFAFLGIIATFTLLLFPDGHLPSPRWRWVARASGASIVLGCLLLVAMTLSDLDLAVSDVEADSVGPLWLNVGLAISWIALLLCVLASFASLIVRWRGANGVARQQLKWFILGGFVQLLGIASGFLSHPIATVVAEASIVALPAAGTLAIMRYRLFDIDRIISRTLAWTLISVVLGGVYVVGVTLFTATTVPLAGDSSVAVAAATLGAAAAFGPARRRIQGIVDRRFNRARYDAALAADRYRSRLRDQLDVGAIETDLVATVRATLQPTGAMLWVRGGGSA